ncbi:uncharacterized protein LOC135501712 [Lineus longissimus]|uniref:uncharacterized protein LOC135501712 n=1 Tax=Lineus longissimus TaxID=88925 RepID=UPI00315D5784
MSEPDFLERLILEIEKFPRIYNKGLEEYKDPDKKDDAWKKVADKLSIGVPLAKSKWKNIRDAMRRYKNDIRTKSGQGRKKVKEYKYAKMLGFLEPFLEDRRSSGNLQATQEEGHDEKQTTNDVSDCLAEDDDQTVDEDHDDTMEPSSSSKTSAVTAKKRKKTESTDVIATTDAVFLNYIKKKSEKMGRKPPTDTDDDVADFMKSMTTKAYG